MAGGRQREFDTEQALEAAMCVFWKKGFGGASLSELTKAMSINKPSMYAAFGNKEQLFVKTTDHYIEHINKPHGKHLRTANISLTERLQRFMMSAVRSQCDERFPKGCYLSLCATEAAGEDMPADAIATLKQALSVNEEMLTRFFQQEQDAGNLTDSTNPQLLSTYIITILQGTAAMARGGKTEQELEPMVAMALHYIDSIRPKSEFASARP